MGWTHVESRGIGRAYVENPDSLDVLAPPLDDLRPLLADVEPGGRKALVAANILRPWRYGLLSVISGAQAQLTGASVGELRIDSPVPTGLAKRTQKFMRMSVTRLHASIRRGGDYQSLEPLLERLITYRDWNRFLIGGGRMPDFEQRKAPSRLAIEGALLGELVTGGDNLALVGGLTLRRVERLMIDSHQTDRLVRAATNSVTLPIVLAALHLPQAARLTAALDGVHGPKLFTAMTELEEFGPTGAKDLRLRVNRADPGFRALIQGETNNALMHCPAATNPFGGFSLIDGGYYAMLRRAPEELWLTGAQVEFDQAEELIPKPAPAPQPVGRGLDLTELTNALSVTAKLDPLASVL